MATLEDLKKLRKEMAGKCLSADSFVKCILLALELRKVGIESKDISLKGVM